MALKIKDDVDLKELEKFGFRPYYDCDTGEISYWYKTIIDKLFKEKSYNEYKIEIRDNRDNTDFSYHLTGRLKKKTVKNMIKFNLAKEGDAYELFFDTLYDLIKAGLVEKVEK